jgi:hypothetical protein
MMPRTFRMSEDQKIHYQRAGSSESCDHGQLEGHVVYDRSVRGYRAEARCRCGLVKLTGARVHATYVEAELNR